LRERHRVMPKGGQTKAIDLQHQQIIPLPHLYAL
jgi:hypothetical protein